MDAFNTTIQITAIEWMVLAFEFVDRIPPPPPQKKKKFFSPFFKMS